ncbi:MAG: hypothetical protein RIF33_13625 [Cyclobacteriaceae bacterium]
MNAIKRLRRYLNPSGNRDLKVESSKAAEFRLTLGDLIIGFLKFEKDTWLFRYSDDFKESTGIKPLTNFPDVNKVYKSDELWPFFSARIPSLSRNKVKQKVADQGIRENDLIALLDKFGKKTITNPFELTHI